MVLSRDQLLDLTRGRAADVFDRSIDNQVSRLRKKIEADPKEPALIKTVWGGGYMLTAEVAARMRRARAWLQRLWPRRLAGQMIALLLLALVLAQAVSLLIFADERLDRAPDRRAQADPGAHRLDRAPDREHAARTARADRAHRQQPPAAFLAERPERGDHARRRTATAGCGGA